VLAETPATESPLVAWPVGALLDAVAAERPAPGAGTCAALSCAMAAGLAEMAASFTIGRERHADVHARMREIRDVAGAARARASELAEAELRSFEPVLEAMRLPAGDPERAQRLAAALSAAADAPLEVAELGATVACLAAEVARDGNANLRGDALAGVALAEAAAGAAARLVALNLEGAADQERVERARACADRAAEARRGGGR
jgi:formiminotetrahydrofolate cyclodeaminase